GTGAAGRNRPRAGRAELSKTSTPGGDPWCYGAMATPDNTSAAAALIRDFVTTGDTLADRADLARFLRDHRLIPESAIPITLADFDEAIALRDGMRAQLRAAAGESADAEAIARAQRVLDGLRVSVRLNPGEAALSPLAPA